MKLPWQVWVIEELLKTHSLWIGQNMTIKKDHLFWIMIFCQEVIKNVCEEDGAKDLGKHKQKQNLEIVNKNWIIAYIYNMAGI